MVKYFVLFVLCALCNSPCSCQSWTSIALIELQEWNFSNPRLIKISIHHDKLAIGDPIWQGRGRVLIHGRQQGGFNSWEFVHALENESSLISNFGLSIRLCNQGLFVASGNDLRGYRIDSLQSGEYQLIQASGVRDLAYVDGVLVTSNPVYPGFTPGIVRMFELDSETNHYIQTASAILSLGGAPELEYPGGIIDYDPPNLVVSDTSFSIPSLANPRIWFFTVDPIANTIGMSSPESIPGIGGALKVKGDTLFVGAPNELYQPLSSIRVFRKEVSTGWDLFKRIRVPEGWVGPEIGDLGTAIAATNRELIVGTEYGLAFYQEVDTGWVFQHFEPLGGAVSSISVDGDLLAVAVPTMGAVHIYERTATSIAEGSPDIASIRVAPNPAARKTTVLPFHATCQVRTLLHTDALGRILEQLPWDGMKPLELEVDRDLSGTTFIKALDVHGRTCATGRVSWIAQ